jgi:YVTN family beta-propeller protein
MATTRLRLKVFLAGRVALETGGVVVDERSFPGRQGRVLFAYLVAERARPVPRDELADALWGDELPATWEKALTVRISQLRTFLSDRGIDGANALTSAFGCYRLELPEGSWVDVLAAADAAREAEEALTARDLDRTRTAASIAEEVTRQPFLPGETGVWVEERRRELGDVRGRALTALADAALQSGDAEAAASFAEQAVALEPFRETGYRRLMEAHAAAGNRAEALRVYERCRRLLAEEIGAYPSPETEAIYRRLLEAAPTDAVRRGPEEPQAVAGERSRFNRRLLAGIALVGTTAGAIVAGVLLSAGGGTRGSVVPNSLVALTSSGSVGAAVAVGASPGGVAAGEGALWVADTHGHAVSRVDPRTHTIRQTIQVGNGPAGVAVGGGGVWVANGLDGSVSRIDPVVNREVQRIGVGNGPVGVAYSDGAVWVANSVDGTVSKIDAATGRRMLTRPAVVGATGVAVGFGRVWVVSPSAGVVVALDPIDGEIGDRVSVGVDPDAIVTGGGAVWVANRADGTVSRIDPTPPAHVTATIPVGRGPDSLTAARNGIWVANALDANVRQIAFSTGTPGKPVDLANPPAGLAELGGDVYVAVRSNGAEHRGGTLRVTDIAPDFLDPALAYVSHAWSILSLTNDGLVGFRRVGGIEGVQLVPDLAVSLPSPTNGGKTYTFRLRPEVRYSTGRLVQPADFRAGLERFFAENSLAAVRAYYGGIVGAGACVVGRPCFLGRGIVADAVARTVTFHLRTPDPDFLTKLAMPWAVPVPPGTPTDRRGSEVPGTGPYMIAAYRPNRSLRLVRNPSFRQWSADAQPDGFPDRITWKFVAPGLDAQVRLVQHGGMDVAANLVTPSLAKEELEALAVNHPSQLHVTPTALTVFFFLNTRVAPFTDVRVRRAVNDAVDRSAVARLLGPGFSPTCQILPPDFPSYRRTCPYPAGDASALAGARRVVRETGAADTPVTVWVPSPERISGRYVVSVLRSLGFRAGLKAVPGPGPYFKWVNDSRHGAQVGFDAWISDFPSPAGFLTPLFSCAAFAPATNDNSDPSGFCDPAVDRLLAQAESTQAQNPAAAIALWQQAERAILAQAPLVPLYNPRNVTFVSKRVGNFAYHPQWGVLLDQLWVR